MKLFLWMLLLAPCVWADPVDDLVARLSKTHGLWVNGLSSLLELPETASSQQLLAGLNSQARLLSAREVSIDGQGPYRALRVVTAEGPRILLLRFEGKSGWWSRFYAEDPDPGEE